MCTGSQEGLARTFAMLLNPEDTLLVESPTYSGSLAYADRGLLNLARLLFSRNLCVKS
jgi:DNA-binding transcriptional MocR family regulator